MEVLTQKLTELRDECVAYIQSRKSAFFFVLIFKGVFAPEVDRVCDELAKAAAKSVENLLLFIQNRGLKFR
jgi:hypothetical protein